MLNNEKIGLYLLSLRKYYKITQEELAERLQVSRQAISKWETGASVPDIGMLLSLSEIYGVTINEILEADLDSLKNRKKAPIPAKKPEAKEVFVIGCGRWGSFLAWYMDRIGQKVRLYGRKGSKTLSRLKETRRNDQLRLPETIALTDELKGALSAEILIISVGAQQLSAVAAELKGLGIEGKKIVLCMKGLEIEGGRRLSQIVSDTLAESNRIAVWLGPGHVQEFYKGVPNCMVIDSTDEFLKDELICLFSSDLIRFYYGTDLIGNEIGAAAKNVIGIAAGMLEGAGRSSLKGALMARGTREISELIAAMGGKSTSAYGLCHLGDYEATLFSSHSQNLAFGKSIVAKTPYTKLAEGYYTAKALHNLSKAYGVELPICGAVYRILYEKADALQALERLFGRSLKNEF